MGNNKSSLIIWLLCGLLGLFTFIRFYEHTHTEASVNLRFGRTQAIKQADQLLRSLGFDASGYDKTVYFSECDTLYLQNVVGIKRTNELIKEEVPCWSWQVRYFKELQKEGFVIGIDPATGYAIDFYHSVLETSSGDNLTQEAALSIAEEFFSVVGESKNDYSIYHQSSSRLKSRTDHSFSWTKKDFSVGDAALLVYITVYGDKVGEYTKYLEAPEQFERYMEKQEMSGWALTTFSYIGMFLLVIAAVFCLVILHKHHRIRWKLALIISAIVIPLNLLSFFNELPLLWVEYTDTTSKNFYLMMCFMMTLVGTLFYSLIIFLFCSAGEAMANSMGWRPMPIIDGLRERIISGKDILRRVVVGYSLAFMGLGYVTAFYLIAARQFDVWQPISPDYSDVLSTTAPFLYPLTIAIFAAFSEEFAFRLFAVSFFKKYLRWLWLAVILTAVIWAFGHSSYPVYPMHVRGIELTFVGIVWAIVYLAYGIETVVIAHYVYNAVLIGLPLLKSNNTYFVSSGLIVIFLLAIPAVLLPVLFRKKAQPEMNDEAGEGQKHYSKTVLIPAVCALFLLIPHSFSRYLLADKPATSKYLAQEDQVENKVAETEEAVIKNPRTAANDARAKAILASMSSAMEAYKKDVGQYPPVMETLVDRPDPYINENYCNQTVAGYRFQCELLGLTYNLKATPVRMGLTGSLRLEINPQGFVSFEDNPQKREQIENDVASLKMLVEEIFSKKGEYPSDTYGTLSMTWRVHRVNQREPLDPFDGAPYGYKVEDNQYHLYSPGPDGKKYTDDDINFTYSAAETIAEGSEEIKE